ncbi:MAG: Hsp20/alpha crystallin family protein [Lachnospiraceae bacterium]|nr:Hsp20/alpha crystallin family protein [Lachnospiraceae bacterium]
MLYPSIFNDSLWDDLMDPEFLRWPDLHEADRKLYGKHADRVMRTDVREHEDHYDVDIDLPGFKKEEITLKLENGYLTVTAAKGLDQDEKTKLGKLIRRERWAGAMERSFYVGEGITSQEIKAKFENGVLQLCVPKKEAKKAEESRTIQIEG